MRKFFLTTLILTDSHAQVIIFLYGPDSYRLKEGVDTIVSSYLSKHRSGINLYRFDLASNRSCDELTNAIKSNSFFNEVKLLLIKNTFSLKSADQIIGLIKDFNLTKTKDIVLVFTENLELKNLKKNNSDLLSLLNNKENLVHNFEYLEGAKLANWVKNKFKENDCNVSSETAGLLVDLVGNESWSLVNEITKLSNYKKGGIVTEKEVNLLISGREINSIFDLTDAVGNKNKAKAFEMMFRLINSGHDPHYLLSMLAYHFENLISVGSLLENNRSISYPNIAKDLGLHPFVVKKVSSQAKNFEATDLLSKFNRLAKLDVASKSGLVNLEDALYNFLFL